MFLQKIRITLGCEVTGVAYTIDEEVSIIDLRHILFIWDRSR